MLNLIKNIFGDISLLYKNFIHFTLSKIVIYLVSILYTVIFAIPFVIIGAVIYFYILNNFQTIYGVFDSPFIFILSIFLIILGFFTIIIAFSYNYVLLTKLNLEYLKGKKLPIGKNYYFNFRLFWTFFKTMFLNFLIILLPFVIGAFLIFILIILFGGIEATTKLAQSGAYNIFTVSSFIVAVLSIIGFVYLMYKTLLTVVILVDESKGEKFKKSMYYIKKSFKLTKGFKTFFRFLVVAIIISIITLPITLPLSYYSDYNLKLADYIDYKTNPGIYDLNDAKTFYYIEDLKAEFKNKSLEELNRELSKTSQIRMILEILNFLFIYGLFEMFLVSLYKRELLKENKKEKSEDKPKDKKKEEIGKKKIEKKEIKKTTKKNTKTKEEIKTKKETKKTTKPKKTTTKKTEEQPIKRKRGRPRKTEK